MLLGEKLKKIIRKGDFYHQKLCLNLCEQIHSTIKEIMGLKRES